MPRVPVISEPSIASAPLSPRLGEAPPSSGLERVGQGLQQLGAGLAGVEEARRKAGKAAALRAVSALSDEASDAYDGEQGAFRKYGEEGFAAIDTAYEHVQRRRQEISDGLSDDYARAFFDGEASLLVEQRRRQGERRKGVLREAIAAGAAEDRLKAAVRTLGSAYADPEARDFQIAAVEDAFDAIGGPENPRTKVAKAKALQILHGTVIAGFMDAHQAEEAHAYLQEHREELGEAAAGLARRIDKVRTADAGDALALQFTEMARLPTGEVDEDRARALLDTIDDVAVKDEATKRLDHRLKGEADDFKTAGTGVKKALLRGYNTTGRFDPQLMAELNDRWPDLATELINMDDRRRARNRRNAADARREIREDNERAMNAYLRIPIEERANVDVEAQFGHMVGNDIGLGDIAALQTKDRAAVQKGQATPITDFVKEGMARSFSVVVDPTAGRDTRRVVKQSLDNARKTNEADLTKAWYQFQEQHKRPPNAEERRRLQDEVLIRNAEGLARLRLQAESGAAAQPASATPRAAAAPRQSKQARARALQAQGKSVAEIASILTAEGY